MFKSLYPLLSFVFKTKIFLHSFRRLGCALLLSLGIVLVYQVFMPVVLVFAESSLTVEATTMKRSKDQNQNKNLTADLGDIDIKAKQDAVAAALHPAGRATSPEPNLQMLYYQEPQYYMEGEERPQLMDEYDVAFFAQSQSSSTVYSLNPVSDSAHKPTGKPAKAEKESVLSNAAKNVLHFLQPLADGSLSSLFGIRDGKMHNGIDLVASSGTSIRAAEEGTVVFSGWQSGYGEMIVIDHGSHLATRYGHASKRLVYKGEKVKRGQIIGLVGNTGHSTGPHLHFEVVANGKFQNPLKYVSPVFGIAAGGPKTKPI